MNHDDLQKAMNLLAVGTQHVENSTTLPQSSNPYNTAILSTLNAQQLNAVRDNPELNKRLRVDRIKRLALYDPSSKLPTASSMADP